MTGRERTPGLGRSTGILTGAMLVSSACLGITAVLSARALGPAHRGEVVLALTLGTFLMLVGGLGVGVYARSALARSSLPLRAGQYRRICSRLAAFHVAPSALAAYVLLPLLDAELGSLGRAIFIAYCVFYLCATLGRDGLTGLGYTSVAALSNAGTSFLTLLGSVALWLAHSDDPRLYLAMFMLGSAVDAVVCWTFLIRRERNEDRTDVYASDLSVVRASLPSLGLILAQTAVLRGDRILLGGILSSSAVGLYAAASTLTELMSMGALAASQALSHPIASGKATRQEVARVGRLIVGATAVGAVGVALTAPVVIPLLLGRAYEGAVDPLRWLAAAVVPYSSYQMDAYILAAKGRAAISATISAIGVAVLLVGDLLLAPTGGILRAAQVCLASYVCIAFGTRMLVIRTDRSSQRSALRQLSRLRVPPTVR